MDLAEISGALVRGENGIWTSRSATGRAAVSFPEDGHAECFRVEDGSFWFGHRNDLITRALARFPVPGAFLDIGGGNGVVSKRLESEGIDTVMIEPGPDGAAHARERGLANVVCATLEEAEFGPNSFGAAGLFDVIEHVEDDAKLLRAARAVLKPGGRLAVTVPAYSWLWSAEDDRAGHYRRYRRDELTSVIERSGFRVEWASYFFAALTAPIFVGRTLRARTGTGEEHLPGAVARAAIDLMLRPEREVVARGGSIPFGSSILAIATAK